jgi:hypothetical protein
VACPTNLVGERPNAVADTLNVVEEEDLSHLWMVDAGR